jgi:hypothetical protein
VEYFAFLMFGTKFSPVPDGVSLLEVVVGLEEDDKEDKVDSGFTDTGVDERPG